jgi:hypothetical protein
MANPSEKMDVYNVTITGSTITVGTRVAANQTIGSNTMSPILYGQESVYTPQTTDPNIYIGTATDASGTAIGFIIKDTNTGNFFLCLPTGTTKPTTTLTQHVSTGQFDNNLTNWNVNTNSAVAHCFLAGTRLLTPAGEIPVETLQVGDLVTTLVAGKQVARPVTWIGHRNVKQGDLRADDAHPIRITAGAFADTVPHRDLLVTAEHCIFIDGGLVPARMLVNGRSIFADTGISSFTYYHVELADHAILLAEGLATESYLNTGSRGNFTNTAIPSLRPQFDSAETHTAWEHAAAPLTTGTDIVRPIWQRLQDRAAALGLPLVTAAPALTNDPALRIVTGNGAVIEPAHTTGRAYLFVLPAGQQDFRLVSKTFRPADTIGPFIDDRRELGVLVGEITLHTGRKKQSLTQHLAPAQLPGWNNMEDTASRWTTGDAILPLATGANPAALEVQILSAGPFRVEAETVEQRARAA